MGDDDRVVGATTGERLPVALAATESHALTDEGANALASEWRRFTRIATVVAVLTSPALFVFFHESQGWGVGWSILVTFLAVVAFRGLLDVAVRRFIPWPTLFGAEDAKTLEQDVVSRRRTAVRPKCSSSARARKASNSKRSGMRAPERAAMGDAAAVHDPARASDQMSIMPMRQGQGRKRDTEERDPHHSAPHGPDHRRPCRPSAPLAFQEADSPGGRLATLPN